MNLKPAKIAYTSNPQNILKVSFTAEIISAQNAQLSNRSQELFTTMTMMTYKSLNSLVIELPVTTAYIMYMGLCVNKQEYSMIN